MVRALAIKSLLFWGIGWLALCDCKRACYLHDKTALTDPPNRRAPEYLLIDTSNIHKLHIILTICFHINYWFYTFLWSYSNWTYRHCVMLATHIGYWFRFAWRLRICIWPKQMVHSIEFYCGCNECVMPWLMRKSSLAAWKLHLWTPQDMRFPSGHGRILQRSKKYGFLLYVDCHINDFAILPSTAFAMPCFSGVLKLFATNISPRLRHPQLYFHHNGVLNQIDWVSGAASIKFIGFRLALNIRFIN